MLANYSARMHCGSCAQRVLESPDENDEAPDLNGSVGENGANLAADVRNVQLRLNSVSPASGGPAFPLAVDGICGPLTKAAIKRFQQRYWRELLGDGRIDPGKNTWKKLVALSEGEDTSGLDARVPKNGVNAHAAPPGDPTMPLIALWLAQYRIYEAIKSLDVAARELNTINMRSTMDVDPHASLFKTYTANQSTLLELPTVDRCFHVAGPKMTFAHANDMLSRLRRLYATMIDVIVATSITTPKAEKNGSRRYVRVVPQRVLNSVHPKGAIADAPDQGWWRKNANRAHIRVGTGHLNDVDLITTMIHEMSHFVSHHSTFIVGQHVSGIYNKAFDDTPHQAVRNAFCYEWFAFLAAFKTQRSLPNSALQLT